MVKKGVLNDYIKDIHSKISLCSTCSLHYIKDIHSKISHCSTCSLPPTAALIQNNKWYHKIHSALLPVHIPAMNSVYFYIPLGQCKPESKVAVDNEGYCYQLWTKGLANCRGNTGDRIAKQLEGDDPWDFFLIPQYTSLNCSTFLKELTVAKLVKSSLLFTEKSNKT